jgi:2-iminobutanoate/2-iminopropanoate deaminase
MDKQVINADVPETGGPFNLCVRYGNLIFISGLPPFDAEFSSRLRDARARGLPLPPFPDLPFERQARIVMDHLKRLVEAAGSNMDCLLKVIVLAQGPAPTGGVRPHLPQLFHRHCDPAGAHAHAGRPHAARLRARSGGDRLRAGLTLYLGVVAAARQKAPGICRGPSSFTQRNN